MSWKTTACLEKICLLLRMKSHWHIMSLEYLGHGTIFILGLWAMEFCRSLIFSPKIPNLCNEPNPRCSIFQFLSQTFNWKLPDKLFCLKEEPQWTCLLVPGIIVMQSFSTLRVPPITWIPSTQKEKLLATWSIMTVRPGINSNACNIRLL